MRNLVLSVALLAALLAPAPAAHSEPILNSVIRRAPYNVGGEVLHWDAGTHDTAHADHGGSVDLSTGTVRLWALADNITGLLSPQTHCIAYARARIGASGFECVRSGVYSVVFGLRWCGLFGVHVPEDYWTWGGASAEQRNSIAFTLYQWNGLFWMPVWTNTIGVLSLSTHFGTDVRLMDGAAVFDAVAGQVTLQAGQVYAADMWLNLESDAGSVGDSGGAWVATQLAPMTDFLFAGQSYTQDGYVRVDGIGIFDANPDHTPPTTFIATGAQGGSYDGPVDCTLGATDGDGYGVQAVYWQLDGGPWQTYNFTYPFNVIDITHDTVLRFYGVDRVGNEEPVHEVAYVIRPPNTWRVPVDAPTIQAGIDSAAAGDTVLVACGTYHERGIVLRTGVTVRSGTGEAGCATIDGDGLDRVFLASGITDATLKGFTITGGRRAWGAGIFLNGASIAVDDCLIHGNVADWPGSQGQGGGIAIESCAPSLRNLTIAGNSGPQGAGLAMFWASPLLENCLIAFNDGLSAYCHSSSPEFRCSDVYGNADGDWTGCFAGQLGQQGNLEADPLFCAPTGTYALDAASPCLAAHNACGALIGALGEGCAVVAVPGEDADDEDTPGRLDLAAVAPNPFNPRTTIRFGLPEARAALIGIYDAAGRQVAVLARATFAAGWHAVTWDGRDARGAPVPAGVYVCRLSSGAETVTRRLTLVR